MSCYLLIVACCSMSVSSKPNVSTRLIVSSFTMLTFCQKMTAMFIRVRKLANHVTCLSSSTFTITSKYSKYHFFNYFHAYIWKTIIRPVSLMFLFGGGVIAVSAVDFVRANGYSNVFWGLGLEDDDFYRRIRRLNMSVTRPRIPVEYLRYRTLYHDPSSVDVNQSKRQQVFDNGYLRFESDGLVNLKYRLSSDLQLKSLYTHVLVKL